MTGETTNPDGRWICSESMPYRPGLATRWVHPKAHETDADSENYIEYYCPICRHTWRTEMPD